MKSLTKFANAKLNLGLQVLNKRADGFHNLSSLFVPITLSDKLIIEESSSFGFCSNVEFDIAPNQNLVVKAYDLMKSLTDFKQEVTIYLEKSIPQGAGLGGGSSDAANVLLIINEMFELGFSPENLAEMGLRLGSDVPFFIYNKAKLVKGRGEKFFDVNFNIKDTVLLIYPNVNISTKEAYQSLNRTSSSREEIDFKTIVEAGKVELFRDVLINDFEPYVFEKYQNLENIKAKLYELGSKFALMSGSGSSIYGLFESEEQAEKAKFYFSDFKTYICNFK